MFIKLKIYLKYISKIFKMQLLVIKKKILQLTVTARNI